MDGKSLLLAAIVFVTLLKGIQVLHQTCKYDQFQCSSGACISRSYFCDGDNDCWDLSDELFCDMDPESAACPVDEIQWFLCDDGRRCIPSAWKLDGNFDCSDESDEIRRFQTTTPLTTTDNSINSASGENSAFGLDAAIYKMVGSLKATRHNARSIAKWGPELPRIAVALFLTDPQYFAPGNATGAELAYELSLQMMSKLALKRKIMTQDLALYINALMVSCIDPKDFFGVNLVAELRKRVNNGNYTNPFIYLTLCNAGDSMAPTDVTKVASMFEERRRPLWTDVQALATMAMACMNSQDYSVVKDVTLTNMIKELKTKQHNNGTIDNARTTALVTQALIATNSYLDDFDFDGAVKYLVTEAISSALSVQDIYYILPVLKSTSLVNVSSNHCSTPIKTELEVLKNLQESVEERIPVRVSMFLGNDIDFVRTWQLKVPATYSFYQVLENIGTLEPLYKVHYSTGEDKKPYIVGIHKYFDDAEEEMFWFIFSQKLRNATRPTLVEKSPVDIQLKENEEFILWYRSGVWSTMTVLA